MDKRKFKFYRRTLNVTWQGFYGYLKSPPGKYDNLVAKIREIIAEDECNDSYGTARMRSALLLKKEIEGASFPRVLSKHTIYQIMARAGLKREPRPKRKRKTKTPTKVNRAARKYDDLLRRNNHADEPCQKCVGDITEIPCLDGKLYVSALSDCFNSEVLGLVMADHMRATLVCDTLTMAVRLHPKLTENKAIAHSDRGSQYTSAMYRRHIEKYGIRQSMNSRSGCYYDNAKAENLWSLMKQELLYGRYDTKKMEMYRVRRLVWQYFMDYWNKRRICTVNGGLPPIVKKQRYYAERLKMGSFVI